MAERQRKFYPISSLVPDPPSMRDSGLEMCSGTVPFNGGMLVVSGRKTLVSNVGSPLLDEDGVIITDEEGAVLNAENFTNSPNNSLHTHYARGKDETDPDKIKYYFNIADLFIGQWDAIYKVGDVLDQMGAQDILNVTNQDEGPYGVGGSTNLYLDPVPWSFASFGWNKVIATNYSDPIQRYVYGAVNDYFESFLAGGATSIRAKFVCTIGQHVLLGNIVVDGTDATTYFGGSGDTFHPQLVWWSGTDNELLFSDEGLNPEANTGYQWLLSTPGPITAMKSVGENEVVIFKPHGIELMSLTGGDALFSFQTISTTIGTLSPQSVVVVGRDVYFVDSSGRFRVIRNLTQVDDLGAGSVETFMSGAYLQANLPALGLVYMTDELEIPSETLGDTEAFQTLYDGEKYWRGAPLNGLFTGTGPASGYDFDGSRVVGMPLRHVCGAYSYQSGAVLWCVRPVISTYYYDGLTNTTKIFSPLIFVIYSIQHGAFSSVIDVDSVTDANSPYGTFEDITADMYELLTPLASYTRYEALNYSQEESGVLYSVRRTTEENAESYNVDDIWGGGRGEWELGLTLATKKFSLTDSPIMPSPGRIHAIRIVTDVNDKQIRDYHAPPVGDGPIVPSVDDDQFGIQNLVLRVKSYDGRTDHPTWKTLGATESANGWFTPKHGSISGYHFQIVLHGTRPGENGPHILGFDIQYSLGGERA